MDWSKSEVQKLINAKNDRVTFTKYDGKSPVWKYFELVKVDNASVPFVRCIQCSCVLKWKSKDGTSGLSSHYDACCKKLPTSTRKLTDLASMQPAVPKVPTHLKSDLADALVWTCAKDIR